MKISDKLTEEQKVEIRNIAICMAYEDAQQNTDYLYGIVTQWVEAKSIENQVGVISSDDDIIPDLLPFDPSTGENWEDDDD